MSYHRILPVPEGLIHPNRNQEIGTDSLLQNRIMTNEKSTSSSKRSKSQESSQRSSSPLMEQRQGTPSVNSPEEYDDSPEPRDRSSSQPSNREVKHLPSISRAWQAESPSDICLCQPDPKVPRPRNAFILYRQHYQGAVVAQNPGLANPEISKVIGEQWRDSPAEVKKHWKSLADEEKLRHQKQHPNYRYQPRRSGRSNSTAGAQAGSTSGETPRCGKCGRRTIATPTTMPSMSTNQEERPPATPRTPPDPQAPSGPRYIRTLGSPGLNGPPSGYHHPDQRQYGMQHGLPSPRFKRPSAGGPQSPIDPKRRRIGPPANYAPVRLAHGPATPFPYRRDSLPPPNFLPHPSGKPGHRDLIMAPPPRPHPHPDPSLTLPPIQTHLATLRDHEVSGNSQAKSLQAMIMSISPLNKIKVLSKISPPLAAPGPVSPKYATRGVAIAIDGQDEVAVKAITGYLIKELNETNVVKVFELEDSEDGKKDNKEPEKEKKRSGSKASSSSTQEGDKDKDLDAEKTYDAYLSLTRRYHALSTSITAFLTTTPTSPTTTSPQPLAAEDDSDSPISPKTIPKPKTRSSTTRNKAPEDQAKIASQLKGLPIALLPNWALTHSDRYACALPITDSYAPVDHWQWMATLWRGIVGADITVAVRAPQVPAETPTTAEMVRTAKEAGKGGGAGGAKGGVGSGGSGGGGNVPVGQAVDVRLEDARAIVLRAAEGGGVPEGSLRRVGFEVGEWVRARGEGLRREI